MHIRKTSTYAIFRVEGSKIKASAKRCSERKAELFGINSGGDVKDTETKKDKTAIALNGSFRSKKSITLPKSQVKNLTASAIRLCIDGIIDK